MRVLYLGDIVGRSGRALVLEKLPELREKLKLDLVVVNGENAAAGFGITRKICDQLLEGGVDVITTGNHIWDQKETVQFISQEKRLIRPINFPKGTPGIGAGIYEAGRGRTALIINVMGRIFMDPLDDPFAAVEEELGRHRLGQTVNFILVDIHCEATSEKQAMGHFCDGRVSFVVGSHSHVPTADAHILEGGTAYQTDAGMCGDYNSVIGMEKEEPLQRFTRKIATGRFSPAMGEGTLCGVFVETDDRSGLAKRIEPVRLGAHLHGAFPEL
ncbi:TIGR00282 family metallophosphoesterase [Emcibacter sp.]|uniref:TIGR00282 family metallophosphoesterase n=1 Tax=Emcibacter sp. TaxID=1979954 RepID=UPI003A941394